MYIYIYTYAFIHIYIYMYVCIYMYIYINICVVSAYAYICVLHVYEYVCVYICTYMYICTYTYLSANMYCWCRLYMCIVYVCYILNNTIKKYRRCLSNSIVYMYSCIPKTNHTEYIIGNMHLRSYIYTCHYDVTEIWVLQVRGTAKVASCQTHVRILGLYAHADHHFNGKSKRPLISKQKSHIGMPQFDQNWWCVTLAVMLLETPLFIVHTSGWKVSSEPETTNSATFSRRFSVCFPDSRRDTGITKESDALCAIEREREGGRQGEREGGGEKERERERKKEIRILPGTSVHGFRACSSMRGCSWCSKVGGREASTCDEWHAFNFELTCVSTGHPTVRLDYYTSSPYSKTIIESEHMSSPGCFQHAPQVQQTTRAVSQPCLSLLFKFFRLLFWSENPRQ